jgi:hypothetical protein
MSTSTSIAFVVVFLLVYALVSYFHSGTIHWPGMIGGAVGAASAFLLSSRMKRNRDQSSR